jgi:hypothetical protein
MILGYFLGPFFRLVIFRYLLPVLRKRICLYIRVSCLREVVARFQARFWPLLSSTSRPALTRGTAAHTVSSCSEGGAALFGEVP